MSTSPIDWQPLHGPLRRLPARAAEQAAPRDARQVCSRCLGGTCCTTEGPIALTAFDVLRLAAALDLSPARFFVLFTQDRFDGPDGERYRAWLDEPGSSVVSFLRRRTLDAASPCLFLRYIVERDGTPRRVCSVHAARPLACREYYHDTCRKRWTGEMAVLQAIGYEALRDGRVTGAEAARRLAALPPPEPGEALSLSWQRALWVELRRAAAPDAANAEGAAEPGLAAHQDALELKIDRLLSTPNLRFEEKYGPLPRDEQLHGFGGGLRAIAADERTRLLRIATRRARGPRLFAGGELRWHLGQRALLQSQPEPLHELRALSAHWCRIGDIAETESAGALHAALALALLAQPGGLRARLQRSAAKHAALAVHLASLTLLEEPQDDGAALPDAAASAAPRDGGAAATSLATLAELAAAGFADAERALSPWLASVSQRAWPRWLRAWRAQLQQPAAALPVLAWGAWASRALSPLSMRRLLTRAWADPALAAADDDTLLAWLALSAAAPGFDLRRAAPARAALQRLAARGSIWDGPGEALAPLWHDAYLLRALRHAALRAQAPALLSRMSGASAVTADDGRPARRPVPAGR
jgi:Fe-S-cluster containining protein